MGDGMDAEILTAGNELVPVPTAGRNPPGDHHRSRRRRSSPSAGDDAGHPLRRILHRPYPATRTPAGRISATPSTSSAGASASGFRDLKSIKPMTVAAYIEQLQAQPRQAVGQAAPRHHPHALRLAGHRPGHRCQPGPRRPRPQARRHQRARRRSSTPRKPRASSTASRQTRVTGTDTEGKHDQRPPT